MYYKTNKEIHEFAEALRVCADHGKSCKECPLYGQCRMCCNNGDGNTYPRLMIEAADMIEWLNRCAEDDGHED